MKKEEIPGHKTHCAEKITYYEMLIKDYEQKIENCKVLIGYYKNWLEYYKSNQIEKGE